MHEEHYNLKNDYEEGLLIQSHSMLFYLIFQTVCDTHKSRGSLNLNRPLHWILCLSVSRVNQFYQVVIMAIK